jgi:hypothetical protein
MQERTLQEMLQDGRIDRQLLWAEPYNELHEWVRIWRYALTQQMAMRRFEQSPTLSKLKDAIPDYIHTSAAHAKALRELAEDNVKAIVRQLPEWRTWARHIPGIGEFSFGKLLGLIGNSAARHLFSSLSRHCGVAPVNGKIEKPQKGQHRPYNSLAKSQLYLIVKQVILAYPKTPNLYGEFYYLSKQSFERKHPDWTKMHIHLSSILRTARLFLSHLWEVCRRTQNLPVREPYPIEYGGHVIKIPAEMALHPFKRRDDVVRAIESVADLLMSENDEFVRDEMQELVERMRNIVQP